MSTVAWDGKVLAADRQATNYDCAQPCSKIKRLKDGTILAVTGGYAEGLLMMQWYEDGGKPFEYPKFQEDKDDWCRLIAVSPSGEIFEYERRPIGMRFPSGPRAWGSGRDYALGAMAAGASAIQAVEIACRFDINSGCGVESFELGGRNGISDQSS